MAQNEKKEFVGITLNKGMYEGRVVEDPTIVPNGDGKVAFLKLRTVDREAGANGQFVDVPQDIPLVVMDSNRVEKIVIPHIQAGRKIYVDAKYKSWMNGDVPGHGMVVLNIILGDKPYVPKNDAAGAGPGVPQFPS